jgi:hypothetical protein
VDRCYFCLLLCNSFELLTWAYVSVSIRPHGLVYLLSIVLALWSPGYQLGSEKLHRAVATYCIFVRRLAWITLSFFLAVDIPVSSTGLEDAP